MNDLHKTLLRYAAFEKKVQQHMTRRLQRFCVPCKGGCCTALICRESIESSFLIRLREISQPAVTYRRGKGWQGDHGCALTAGRPPVCYEFICDTIERAHAAPLDRYVLKVLCRLVTHTGKRLAGRLHAVEIAEDHELAAIRFDVFLRKLEEAEAALQTVKSYHAGNALSAENTETLVRIWPLPPSLQPGRSDARSRT